MSPVLSLIISFYNKIDYLRLVLAALENQSFKNFEVIIADDGSNEEVLEQLRDITKKSSLNVLHVWHEDIGFRKNQILNKSIVAAKGEYLVFIDGDCIPHKDFINDHYECRTTGTILAGRRVNMSEKITSIVISKTNLSNFPDSFLFIKMMWDQFFGKSKHIEKGIRIPNPLNNLFNKKERGVLGCNFSLHKKDILAVNGFDERYTSPCVGEDVDIEYRLKQNGIKVRSLKFKGIQYHLYHKRITREHEKMNLEILNDSKKNNIVYTPYGITPIKEVQTR